MIAANRAVQRPADARLLAMDPSGRITHARRTRLVDLLREGDLVVANDAMTLPASLAGIHARTGRAIELRLAQRRSLDPRDVRRFVAIAFGEGDRHARTEDREPPPPMREGDALRLGRLHATVSSILVSPRLVEIEFEGDAAEVWAGLASHGRPIQYAYMEDELALWDVWTPIAAVPAAFEPPSAGFALDWRMLRAMREAGVQFATLTHAAGISSTGDASLDGLLPFDEPYRIPERTAALVARTRRRGGRVIAVGTTVVRALESAALASGGLQAGSGIATGRVGASTPLRIVDAILSGTHEPATSHHELLHAFADARTLREADRELRERCYRTHEFGDSVFIERQGRRETAHPPTGSSAR